MKDSTRVIHAGETNLGESVITPIFQSATFIQDEGRPYSDIKYLRMGNTPTHESMHEKLASLDRCESALASSSGMASITATFLSFCGAGSHILAQKTLYGGTHVFLTKMAPRFGIEVTFVDLNETSWPIKSNTKMMYVEALSNPLVEPIPIDRVLRFCRENKILSVIDNTLTSPVNLKPIPLGFDLAVYSATKSLNGHSDLVAGAVVGRRELVSQIRETQAYLGGCMDAHTAFLFARGLKTVELRVHRQNTSAQRIAETLRGHSKVANVFYPNEKVDHYQGFGGVLSFEIGGSPETFLDCLKFFAFAPSLGGVESLVTRPSRSSHAAMTPDQRAEAGVSDNLIRLSVGCEDPDDLIEDLHNALAKC